jgi:D-galactarolactone isomerase
MFGRLAGTMRGGHSRANSFIPKRKNPMEICQGPREIVQSPKFDVPPLACDCHQHILGPVSRFPYAEPRSFTPPDASEEDYLRMLATLRLERTVVIQASVYGTDNSRLLAAVNNLGQHRARGVAMVGKDVDKETLSKLDAGGVRATRFITTAKGGPGLEDLAEVARRVAPFGWHIELYVPIEVWPDLLPVIDTLAVPIVFDHMAAMTADRDSSDPVLSDILRKLESGRHWVKLCGYRASKTGYPYADVTPLAQLLVKHAPDRCVWGTDWPHTNIPGHMPDDGELLNLLPDWVPDAAARHKILVENPAALYRF